ncbi:MAG: hypothetical protein ACYC8T_19380 [Myxococcaceae bacterium]
MKDPDGLKRRELLAAASTAFLCACASMPARPGESGGGASSRLREDGRACDHDLCRYHVRAAGEDGPGRCGIGLPEAFR